MIPVDYFTMADQNGIGFVISTSDYKKYHLKDGEDDRFLFTFIVNSMCTRGYCIPFFSEEVYKKLYNAIPKESKNRAFVVDMNTGNAERFFVCSTNSDEMLFRDKLLYVKDDGNVYIVNKEKDQS